MDDRRRDPDALLLRVQAEEAKKSRGKLKIFFGASPGVGKTYTMLEAGREQAREGIDVLVGYIEPHVRPETQALVLGLDVLARKEVIYRGTKLIEFDLESALAKRPQLILVDELAHTNAPGMTHAKRWQDVVQLLEAGISVYTTLNVQHLESLRDVIAQITGILVAETVPDSVFEEADEVELVDLPADGLLERMREGKVYVAHQAERAVQSFFKKGNLIALRELALRKAAERVGAEMEDYREQHGVTGVWPVNERLLVCVGPSPFSTRLVRATRRIAGSLKAPWIAVHVETPADTRLSDRDREQLSQTLNLVEQLGGETATLSGHSLADELVHYARSRNVSKIIVGKPNRPRWREWLQGSLVYELTRKCGDIDVYVITGDREKRSATAAEPAPTAVTANAYLASLLMVVACTLISWPLSYFLATTNLIMVYLLGVVIISTRFGRGPSVLASVLSVAAFDFFFIPPVLTFAVQDTQYLFTFAVMLGTAITISTLTTRVTFQAESARKRERRTASLYAISHQLAAARTPEQIAQAAVRHVAEAVDAKVAILLAGDGDGRLSTVSTEVESFDPSTHDEAVARWVFDHGETAGHGTATLPGSAGLYLPLSASHGSVGVLGVLPNRAWHPIEPERLHLLETLSGLDCAGRRARPPGRRSRSDSRADGNRKASQLVAERRVARSAHAIVGDYRSREHAAGQRRAHRAAASARALGVDPRRGRIFEPPGGQLAGHDATRGRSAGSAQRVAERRGDCRRGTGSRVATIAKTRDPHALASGSAFRADGRHAYRAGAGQPAGKRRKIFAPRNANRLDGICQWHRPDGGSRGSGAGTFTSRSRSRVREILSRQQLSRTARSWAGAGDLPRYHRVARRTDRSRESAAGRHRRPLHLAAGRHPTGSPSGRNDQ